MILEASKVNLYYKKYGSGQPLILLHGNGEDHTIFEKAIPLLENYFTVYAIDSRGHGKSSGVSELHYEELAGDIYEFICQLQLEKPIVYGFSDGGIVALLLEINHPNLLSQMVISGVNTQPDGIKAGWLFLFKLAYFFTKSSQMKLMITEPDISMEMLKKIQIPVAVTAGSKDVIKLSHICEISETIPKSTLEIFKGETHDSYVIGSEKIAEYIIDVCVEKRTV